MIFPSRQTYCVIAAVGLTREYECAPIKPDVPNEPHDVEPDQLESIPVEVHLSRRLPFSNRSAFGKLQYHTC
jgi:hypothetical protein